MLADASASVLPASGQKIALDFALDVKGSASSTRDAQLIYASTVVQGGSPAFCGSPPIPVCEDRTWCAPTLE
jgi:hypothetical protein